MRGLVDRVAVDLLDNQGAPPRHSVQGLEGERQLLLGCEYGGEGMEAAAVRGDVKDRLAGAETRWTDLARFPLHAAAARRNWVRGMAHGGKTNAVGTVFRRRRRLPGDTLIESGAATRSRWGNRHDCAELTADRDGWMVFPSPTAQLDQEWLYLADASERLAH